MKKLLIILAALTLTGCNLFGERWNHTQVYCLNAAAVDEGAVEATLSVDTVSNERFLNFRDELGRPQRVNITMSRDWICAEKQGVENDTLIN